MRSDLRLPRMLCTGRWQLFRIVSLVNFVRAGAGLLPPQGNSLKLRLPPPYSCFCQSEKEVIFCRLCAGLC
jgi:hypothetical protein